MLFLSLIPALLWLSSHISCNSKVILSPSEGADPEVVGTCT